MGAKIDPCGTPQDRTAASYEYYTILTLNFLFERYDLNHSRAAPLIPTQCSKRASSIA